MNKKISFPIAIIIIVVCAVLAGLIVWQYGFTIKEKEIRAEFPIDSEEEAIDYAKTDPDVKEFIKGWSIKEFEENSWAVWDPNRNIWEVGINPITEEGFHAEYLFVIHFKRDGTVIDKGVVSAA